MVGRTVITCSESELQRFLVIIIASLGFLILLKHFIFFLSWILHTFLRSEKDLIGTYGSWALITGATDGIGKAFALGLARRGLNLILVSRSSGKLRSVSEEIRAEFPRSEIRTVEIDFSDDGGGGGGMKRLREAVLDGGAVDLGIVVNNVGITYPEARYFDEVEEEVWRKMVRVNVEGTMAVTKTVMRVMMENRRGAIVNIGSGAGIVVPSHPLYAIYGATKAYVYALSRSLHAQYRHHGIHVQCQIPLYVATKMTARVASIEKASIFVASAKDYAEAGIRRIGYEIECSPYWSHSLQSYFASFVPHFLLDAWRLSIGIRRSRHIITPHHPIHLPN